MVRAPRNAPWALLAAAVVVVSGLGWIPLEPSPSGATTADVAGRLVPAPPSPRLSTDGTTALRAAELSVASGLGPGLTLPGLSARSSAVRLPDLGSTAGATPVAPRPAAAVGWRALGTIEARFAGGMAYDASDGYVLEFGGQPDGASTWEFANGTWTNLTDSVHGDPPARFGSSMVYDAGLEEILLFGGFSLATPDGATLNDTWSYHAGTWTNRTGTVGAAPESRYLAGLAYDANDSTDVLFGGISYAGDPINGTWEFVGGHWANVSTEQNASPPGVPSPAMAADPSAGDVALFGGGTEDVARGDTWEFHANRWTNVTSGVGRAPPTVAGAVLTPDTAADGALLFGGYSAPPPGSELPAWTGGTWLFSGGIWTNVSDPSTYPDSREYESIADDPAVGGVILYSGVDDFLLGLKADTWSYSNRTWTELLTPRSPPPALDPTMVYDSTAHEVVLFGGSGLNTTWSYSGGNWTLLHPSRSPPGRVYATMSDDPADGEVVLFGGERVTPNGTDLAILNDTWGFANGTWTNLTSTAHGPPARVGAMSAYDSTSEDVVLFGGENETTLLNGTWTFHAGRWTEVPTGTEAPTGRYSAAFADDPGDSGVLLFGGAPCDGSLGGLCNDTWTFSDGAWTEHATRTQPSPRATAGIVYDPTFDADVLTGGVGFPCWVVSNTTTECSPEDQQDTWEYKAGVWTNLTSSLGTPPQGGFGADFVEDSADGYALLLGNDGSGDSIGSGTWWSLSAGTSTPLAVGPIDVSSDPTVVNASLNFTVGVSGGAPAYTVTWTGLPAGCASTNRTELSCSPTTVGEFRVVVNASDADGDLQSSPPLWLNVTAQALPLGSVRVGPPLARLNVSAVANLTAYAFDTAGHAVSGATFAWTVSNSTLATLNATTGPSVSVTGAAPGDLTVSAKATYGGTTLFGTDELVVTRSTGLPLALVNFTADPSSIPAGTTTILRTSVGGGTEPYSYVYSGLPNGCGSSNIPNLTCAPVSAGAYSVSVQVTDAAGASVHATLHLTVAGRNLGASSPLSFGEVAGIAAIALLLAILAGYLLARQVRRRPPPPPVARVRPANGGADPPETAPPTGPPP